MLSMMNTKLAKGEKSDEDPKRKVGYREIKRREKTMKDYARKGAKRTTATTLNQKKFRERERERPRENFGFLLLSSYRRRYYYAL